MNCSALRSFLWVTCAAAAAGCTDVSSSSLRARTDLLAEVTDVDHISVDAAGTIHFSQGAGHQVIQAGRAVIWDDGADRSYRTHALAAVDGGWLAIGEGFCQLDGAPGDAPETRSPVCTEASLSLLALDPSGTRLVAELPGIDGEFTATGFGGAIVGVPEYWADGPCASLGGVVPLVQVSAAGRVTALTGLEASPGRPISALGALYYDANALGPGASCSPGDFSQPRSIKRFDGTQVQAVSVTQAPGVVPRLLAGSATGLLVAFADTSPMVVATMSADGAFEVVTTIGPDETIERAAIADDAVVLAVRRVDEAACPDGVCTNLDPAELRTYRAGELRQQVPMPTVGFVRDLHRTSDRTLIGADDGLYAAP